MDAEEIIERLAYLFTEDDLIEIEACEFIAKAEETFKLVLAARELLPY